MRMRGAVSIALCLVASTGAGVAAEKQLTGKWTGTYRCQGQPEASMTLEIPPSQTPVHAGVFSFDAGGTKGSYSVAGRMRSGRQFNIIAKDWIDQPKGVTALGLTGRLAVDGRSMEGQVRGCAGGSFSATRPASAQEEAADAAPMFLPQGNSTPPVPLGDAVGGALGAATSAEGQCRVLGEWYAPVVRPKGFDGMSGSAIIATIAPVFRDKVFEPVFGLPLALLDNREAREIGHFVKQVCYDRLKMERYRNVFSDVFRSPIFAGDIVAIHKRQDETTQWAADARAQLDAMRAAGPEALNRLRALESSIRFARLPEKETTSLQAEASALRVELEAAAREEKVRKFLADLENAGNDLASGHLGTALRVADQAHASDLEAEQIDKIVAAARAKAMAILEPRLAEAAALASTVPASLSGLMQARSALRPFEEYRASMDRTFGSVDPAGLLKPMYERIRELESDPAVLAELDVALAAAVVGERPRDAVEVLAARVTGSGSNMAGDIASMLNKARDDAEVASVIVDDDSVSRDQAEPTAREIANFALDRARKVNAQMAAMDDACTSGGIRDPVAAMACLSNPAVWTGQKGSGVTLLRVTKIGCEPEQPGTQYLCTFVQELRIDIAGGEVFGAGRWGDLSQALTSGEAVDARFIRSAGGSWNVLTGDLR
jgi:hypothetical protein